MPSLPAPLAVRLAHDPQAAPLVLSPHLDDAVLSCWSALRPGVQVVTVFAGVPPAGTLTGWDAQAGATDSAALVRARREEDRAALGLTSCRPVHLEFLDAHYRDTDPSAEELAAAVVAAVPAAAAICVPAGIGGHADHLLARAAALELIPEGMPASLYAELPYAAMSGWPASLADGGGLPEEWADEVAGLPVELGSDLVRVLRLGAPEAARKLEAMRAYATQFALLDDATGHALSDPAVHGQEVLLTLTPAARPSPW